MLHDEIDKLIADAIKSQDAVKLKTLRMIKSEFVKREKDGTVLTDVVESNILTKTRILFKIWKNARII